MNNIKFVFFGSSQFSKYVLDELEKAGFSPLLNITSAKEELPMEKLQELNADVFVVASFGKILPEELIYMPAHKTLNVHPSLLPVLRGPAPIQGTILGQGEPGVTIIRMDEKMDHGPIIAQKEVPIDPWPDKYEAVEEKLGRAGGQLLAEVLPKWIKGEIKEAEQNEAQAKYIKMIRKEDGLIDLNDPAEKNLRKVLAYHRWPQAFFFFKKKNGKEVRIVVREAEIKDGTFTPVKVIPEGKKEMPWTDFLRGN